MALGTCDANVVVDPVSGDILAISEGDFYKFIPSSNTWSAVSATPPADPEAAQTERLVIFR